MFGDCNLAAVFQCGLLISLCLKADHMTVSKTPVAHRYRAVPREQTRDKEFRRDRELAKRDLANDQQRR